jgi:3-oxoadipate CoA-transferase alpha subunit
MKNKVWNTFDEAVADVPDGASIMIGGFSAPGVPLNLVAALVRQGARDLTVITNHPESQLSAGALVDARQVRRAYCAFSASTHPSRRGLFEELVEAGEIEAFVMPQGTLVERMRAAAAGIGAFYTRASIGTELAETKEHRVIDGKEYVLEYPLAADYAFIRATRADTFGNLQYHGTQRNFNPIMAMAARVTVAEIEGDIVEPGGIDPDHVHTPGIFVDRIIKVPPRPEGLWTLPEDRRD